MRDESLDHYESEALRRRVLKTRMVPAENLFDLAEGKTFELGGERVEVSFPGHAQAPDNVVVWFAERKILFGGCIVKPERLGYLRDADVRNWPAVARKLLEFGGRAGAASGAATGIGTLTWSRAGAGSTPRIPGP